MCSVAPEDDQLPLVLSCWCSIDSLMIFVFLSPLYTDPHEGFNSHTPVDSSNTLRIQVCQVWKR